REGWGWQDPDNSEWEKDISVPASSRSDSDSASSSGFGLNISTRVEFDGEPSMPVISPRPKRKAAPKFSISSRKLQKRVHRPSLSTEKAVDERSEEHTSEL